MPPYETNKPIGVILFDVNGDPVDMGGGVGENVAVTNFPSSYPLPDAQVIALTPPAAIIGYSTEATLAAVLAKIIAAPSTEAKQDAMITALGSLGSQATLADILAKLIVAPATEAKQDAGNALLTSIEAKDFATQATLAAILAKIIAAPATEAKQDTGNASLATIVGKDFATQTTLAAILAKIIAAPSTEAKQDSIIALITTLNGTDFSTESTLMDLYNLILGIDFGMDSTLQDILAAVEPSNASATGTGSNVSASATSVTLLAASASRKGATFYNDSTATLYLKCGAAASLSSFTTVLPPRAYFELPFKYTGIVDGIWSSATGAARITQFT